MIHNFVIQMLECVTDSVFRLHDIMEQIRLHCVIHTLAQKTIQ